MLPVDPLDSLERTVANGITAVAIYVFVGLLHAIFRAIRRRPMVLSNSAHRSLKITMLLTELGSRLGADRAYLAEYHNGDHFFSGSEIFKKSRTHEWTAAGVAQSRPRYQDVLVSLFPDEMALVDEEGPSYHPTSDLPIHSTFRHYLESEGVNAVARCAVMRGSNVIGFVGLDFIRRHEKPSDEELYQIVLITARIEQALKEKL